MLSVKYLNGSFVLDEDKNGAVCHICPAKIELIGGGEINACDFDKLSINDTYFDEGNGLFKVVRVIENISDNDVTFRDIFEVTTAYVPSRYLIPCVNYNGNDGCRENTPIGLCRDGKPWIFAYDRMGIPSCSLCEDKEFGSAIFASDCDATSLRSSASLIKN